MKLHILSKITMSYAYYKVYSYLELNHLNQKRLASMEHIGVHFNQCIKQLMTFIFV